MPARRCCWAARSTSTQAIQFAPNTAAQFANGPYSPSTLVLAAPLYMFGAISGFTFADRLVLEGVTAVPARVAHGLQQRDPDADRPAAGRPDARLQPGRQRAGRPCRLRPQRQFPNGQTIISFVSPTAAPVAPSLAVPVALEGAAGVPVLVPNIVLNTPRPSPTGPAVSTLVTSR